MKRFLIIVLACLCSELSAAVIFTAVSNVSVQHVDDDVFYDVDFDRNGTKDLVLRASGLSQGVQALPERMNRVFGTVQNLPYLTSDALHFDAGDEIGSSVLGNPEWALIGTTMLTRGLSSRSYGPTLLACAVIDSETVCFGFFQQGQPGYLGVEFSIGDQIHYGYVSAIGTGYNGVIVQGFAYETQPGVPIIAGAVPEPTALALLIPGMFLLLSRRRCDQRNWKCFV